jgi:hypothetical protein
MPLSFYETYINCKYHKKRKCSTLKGINGGGARRGVENMVVLSLQVCMQNWALKSPSAGIYKSVMIKASVLTDTGSVKARLFTILDL